MSLFVSGGRQQVRLLAASARWPGAELAIVGRPHPCRARREGAGKSDPDQDHGRRRSAPTRARCCSTAGRSVRFAGRRRMRRASPCIFRSLSADPRPFPVADTSPSAIPPRRFGLDRPGAAQRRMAGGLARPGAETSIRWPLVRTCQLCAGRWSELPGAGEEAPHP